MARDWVAVGLVLVAYREMDWFSALPRNFHLELHLARIGTGRSSTSGDCSARSNRWARCVPVYLELCYALVYAVAPFVVAVLYFQHRRKRVNGVVFLYLLGTLLAYALFPFFPSDPPRVAFGASDMPNVMTPLRQLNLWLVRELRHPFQRVSERARLVGILGGLGADGLSAGAQAIRNREC